MEPQPFWESAFEDVQAPSPFGPPSDELIKLLPSLPPHASVLDLGCGDGRNALFLARHGCQVHAVDISSAAITKLLRRAEQEHVKIDAHVADLRDYQIDGMHDLIVAHGCLHLLDRPHWQRMIAEAKAHTQALGYHVVVVFTDVIPPPDDLRPWMRGLFKERELFSLYSEWRLLTQHSYVLEDEHPGDIKHRHPINKLVAQRPG